MSNRLMRIHGLRPCPCERHAWVVLLEEDGDANVRLRVHNELVPFFMTEGVGPGARLLLGGIESSLAAMGQEPEAVIVTPEERRIAVSVRLSGAQGVTEVEWETGVAMLAARHLDLPIYLREDVLAEPAVADKPAAPAERTAPAARTASEEPAVLDRDTAVPEVFHEALTELGLARAEAED